MKVNAVYLPESVQKEGLCLSAIETSKDVEEIVLLYIGFFIFLLKAVLHLKYYPSDPFGLKLGISTFKEKCFQMKTCEPRIVSMHPQVSAEKFTPRRKQNDALLKWIKFLFYFLFK